MSRPNNRIARLAAGRRTSRAGRRCPSACELVYRRIRPPAQIVQTPAPRIIRNTVHQTVVHLHQTTHQHIRSQITAGTGGHGHTTLLVRQTAAAPAYENMMDPSRPAATAHRLLRILSAAGVRRIMRPFYREIFTRFLKQTQEEHRGKPAESLLAQAVLRRRQAPDILLRLYRRTVRRSDETILRSRLLRRYIRTVEETGERIFLYRYAVRELPVPEDLRRLPAARRVAPLPEPQMRAPAARITAPGESPPPVSAGVLRPDDAGFRVLVGRVADALDRQRRLESLRRGGM